MKYLITGGCGFIGCNFAEKLLQRKDSVIIFDNLSRKGTTDNLSYLKQKFPDIKFEHGDIRTDSQKLTTLAEKVDMVFHLAGQVAVTTSVVNPREDFEINALGTLNVLEAIRLSKQKPALIYTSTNKVYGGMEDLKIIEKNNKYEYKDLANGISESRNTDFHSPYGCSKGAADQYVRDYARIYNLKTVVMRQSCIYGTRQFGIEDQGWAAWFVIAAVLKKPITIYGDGKQVRDILFIDDLFNAFDAATKHIDKAAGQIYNVGGGPNMTVSLLEFMQILGKLLNKKIPYKFSDWRPGDQPVYVSDISKIKKDLSWAPKVDIQDGVKKLCDWVKENKEVLESFDL